MSEARTPSILFVGLLAACGPALDAFTIEELGDAGSEGARPDGGGVRLDLAPVDILFVVDDSASMAAHQARLAENISRFVDQVAGVGSYRIGVVGTDVVSPMAPAGHAAMTHADTHRSSCADWTSPSASQRTSHWGASAATPSSG